MTERTPLTLAQKLMGLKRYLGESGYGGDTACLEDAADDLLAYRDLLATLRAALDATRAALTQIQAERDAAVRRAEEAEGVKKSVARTNKAIKESDAHICTDGFIRPYMQTVCSGRCHYEKPTEFRQLMEEKAELQLQLDAALADASRLAGIVERLEDKTSALIRQAIKTADFIEDEYRAGNDDGDIIPASEPAHKVHAELWGAIFVADLPDNKSVILEVAEAAALAARDSGKASGGGGGDGR